MKLLIQKPISLYYLYASGPEDFEDDALEEFDDLVKDCSEILDELAVQYSFVNNYTSCYLILHTQKINLEETDMNTLFYYVLNTFDTKIRLRYVARGGMGCDMCLELEVIS